MGRSEYTVRRVKADVAPVGERPRLTRADEGYLRLKLSSMFVSKAFSGWRTLAPVFELVTSVHYDGEVRDVVAVAVPSAPGGDQPDERMWVLDATLLPWTPFKGGDVKVKSRLCAVPTGDRSTEVLDAIGWAASVFGGSGLVTAVKLSGEIKRRVDRLLDAILHDACFGLETSLSLFFPDRAIASDHLAFVRASEADLPESLGVRQGRLVLGVPPGHTELYTEHDHFVLCVETAPSRELDALPGFASAWRRLRRAKAERRQDDAQRLAEILLDLLWESPELVEPQRDAAIERVQNLLSLAPEAGIGYQAFDGRAAGDRRPAPDPIRWVPESLDEALGGARPERVAGRTFEEILRSFRDAAR